MSVGCISNIQFVGFYVLATPQEANDINHPKWQNCRERAILLSQDLQPILHENNKRALFFLVSLNWVKVFRNVAWEITFQFETAALHFQHQVYLVASRCCPASYANTNSKKFVNCRIIETLPPFHDKGKGYPSLHDFIAVLRSGMVKLQVLDVAKCEWSWELLCMWSLDFQTFIFSWLPFFFSISDEWLVQVLKKGIKPGEELFCQYDLLSGTQFLTSDSVPSSDPTPVPHETLSTNPAPQQPSTKAFGTCGECLKDTDGTYSCDVCGSFMHGFCGDKAEEEFIRRCTQHQADGALTPSRSQPLLFSPTSAPPPPPPKKRMAFHANVVSEEDMVMEQSKWVLVLE